MRRNVTRSQLVTFALFVGLMLTVGWSYGRLVASYHAAEVAAEQLEECQQLADGIRQLQARPLCADLAAHSASDLARLVEESAKAAKVPLASLVQIDPQSARRVNESVYKEQPTHLELRDVTLSQLITILHALSEDDLGLQVAELRLRVPRNSRSGNGNRETWMAEVVLTHLIFAP